MPRIPPGFIEELLTRIDIVEVIDKRVQLKKHGREFAACCPFHNEKTPSFYVSPVKQFYHCFGCGAHGTAIGFLMDYEHMEFPDAVRELASIAGVEVPEESGGQEKASSNAPLYEVLDRAARFYREQLKLVPTAIEYLKQRGLTGEIAAQFGIGYAPAGWDNLLKQFDGKDETNRNLLTAGMLIRKDDGRYHDRFRERIMFPIRDNRGRIIAFGGRVLGKEEPKYLNSPETPLFHKGRELYGLYEARQALRNISCLMVVEGYMDVVALHQHGVAYAVATLGTATTADHLQRLFRVAPEVVFCFDGDRAGRSAAWRALENALPEAREGRQIKFLFLPEGEDPDTLVRKEGKEAFEARLKQATPLSRFLCDSLAAQTELDSAEGRARLVELARPHLNRVPAGVFRDLLAEEFAHLAQVDSGKLTMLNRTVAPGPQFRIGQGAGRQDPRPQLTSPVRKAIALLLHRPQLAALAGEPETLDSVSLKGAEVLKALVEFARSHPHINGAGLLEHWRDTETGATLMKLAQAELVTPDEAMESEFAAVMADLTGRRPAERRRDELIAESRRRGLNPAEKAELSRLLVVQNSPESITRGTKTD
ncbi:MAG TPA: DNA primase [Gammaproteobacteria bacterium]|nr:DNA primase [Gammaproteobacteria bacterium]